MSNFRLNLPVDIPWNLVNCSEDMMDKTFCDKKMPTPFRSSIALYTYEPKEEDIPEEYSRCGQQITYLKVSCSITGYQPNDDERNGVVNLLSSFDEINYSKIEEIISEYFGCYGVLLNVSVHPDKDDRDNLSKYPHIIDFEPKVRDFYQAATETGEILTSSVGKVTTNKSFGTTDSTQNSWNAGATIRIPEQQLEVAGVGGASQGSPGEIRGDTGQVRTETDQLNWGVSTDASRERREGQATTTQLSQMYNLLTGYHSGTNRASFLMLPRPHILQPTDRRTFVQGLRAIEGVQDFFLIVLRDKDQPILRADVFLQTGHFPEVIQLIKSEEKTTFEEKTVEFDYKKSFFHKDELGGGWETKTHVFNPKTIQELNENWQVNIEKENTNRGVIEENRLHDDPPPGSTLHSLDPDHKYSWEQNIISTDYRIEDNKFLLEVEYKVENGKFFYHDAFFERKYTVHLKKNVSGDVDDHADTSNLLILQRKLCTQITYGDFTRGEDLTIIRIDNRPDKIDPDSIFDEYSFDLRGINLIPDLVSQTGNKDDKYFGYARKKAIIRKIQSGMINSVNSPTYGSTGKISYLQSKHFQKRLLQILPERVLKTPIYQLDFINSGVKERVSKEISLKELLSSSDLEMQKKYNLSRQEILVTKNQDSTEK